MSWRKVGEVQPSLWIPTAKLPTTPATLFYVRLIRPLKASWFGDAVRELCEPHYRMDPSRGGRPEIDP